MRINVDPLKFMKISSASWAPQRTKKQKCDEKKMIYHYKNCVTQNSTWVVCAAAGRNRCGRQFTIRICSYIFYFRHWKSNMVPFTWGEKINQCCLDFFSFPFWYANKRKNWFRCTFDALIPFVSFRKCFFFFFLASIKISHCAHRYTIYWKQGINLCKQCICFDV